MVLSLQHFALGVPDLKVGVDFYTSFGLNMKEGDNSLGFRCDGRSHDEVVLIETGQDRKFQYISFGADQAGLDRISKALQVRGVVQLDSPFPDAPEGLWFRDPDNNFVNVHLIEFEAIRTEAEPAINRPGIYNRVNERGCPVGLAARPRRFGHMILFTPDVARQQRFYVDVIGMQVSDTIVDEYASFMRTSGDSDHHVLGLLQSTAPGFHHASFEMATIDEMQVATNRLFGAEVKHAWGPGRHGVGSNYFHYFRDPWNGMMEYFFDIDFITADYDWKVEDWTKKDGMFLWSADGPPPKDFGTNYEAY